MWTNLALVTALSIGAVQDQPPVALLLPQDEREAARACLSVINAIGYEDEWTDVGENSEATVYGAIAAKLTPGTGRLFLKMGDEIRREIPKEQAVWDNRGDLLPLCRARFVAATGASLPVLPTDVQEQVKWCYVAADALINTLRRSGDGKDYPERARLEKVRARAMMQWIGPSMAIQPERRAQIETEMETATNAATVYRLDSIAATCPDR